MKTIVPEGYKKTKVGVIPNDWQLYRTDKVLKRVRNSVDVIADEEYKQIGIRSHGKGIFYKETVLGKELGNKSVFWIEPDCFIVNIVFAWEQAIGKTTENELGMIASHRFPMYKPQPNKVDLDYLVYLFKSKRGKYLLELASPGGAGRNKTLGQGEFAELEIALPPFKEQQKIANIFTIYDEAIVKQEELIKEKEQLKKGLMQKLLSGTIRFDGFDDEWEEVRLGDIGEFKTSSIDKIVNENEKLVNLINYMDVYRNKHINQNFKCSETSLKEEQYEKVNLKKGDILFTPSSETPDDIGHSAVIIEDLPNTVYSYHLVRFRPKKSIDLKFSGYVFNNIDILKEFAKRANGSTRFTLSIKDFNETKAKLPSLPEQQKIAEVLSLADNEINLLKNELEELKLQKKALMQKLLTGEVRVKV
ncbi:restriction endonuclease subunit S [Sulfurimonas sp. CVO]|uniref:restriction endonuclease subunit S n=1 Tax=Sulfurimonas sp. CVO TaxID=2283483 RepID=UPI00132ED0F6|nr:restriction endonuclease subunit S [Sulfurimonas sp. CVO]QHG91305.1 restriction endonuclease subunit S [Sulfurimonas sp. CVO]